MIYDRFPVSLVEDMFNGNARFGHIIHVPTLVLSEGQDKTFMDFVDDTAYNEPEFLAQWPELKSHLSDLPPFDREEYDELAAIFSRYCPADFLVRVEAPIPMGFIFKNNRFVSCSRSWGHYRTKWILAKDLISAANQAIGFSSSIFNEEKLEAQLELKK